MATPELRLPSKEIMTKHVERSRRRPTHCRSGELSFTANMSACCSLSNDGNAYPGRHRCPVNGHEYPEVSARTIACHVAPAANWKQTAKRYFFCDDPACDVVYFGDDGSTLVKSQLRTRVGLKEGAGDALLCYCFGISKQDFESDPAVRDFVIAQTKAGRCSCETSNPSGRCCLKDFPKPGPCR